MSHLTGATAVTATTAGDANGYVVCGGQTLSDATSPMNGQIVPNLNNSIFLMGSATAGSTGGGNTVTLVAGNLPSHSHTINHAHANTFGLTNATVASSTHTHNIAHAHQWAYFESTGTEEFRTLITLDDSVASIGGSDSVFMRSLNAAGGADAQSWLENMLGSNTSLYTTGVLSPPTGSDGSTAASGTPSATSTVTLSGAVTDHSGNSGSTGSGSSFDNRPAYITAKYIMRVK